MRFLGFLVINIFVVALLHGQKSIFEYQPKQVDTLKFEVSDPQSLKESLFNVKNLTSDTLLFYWDISLVSCGELWEYSICDANTCYSPFVKACPDDAPNRILPSGMILIRFDVHDNGVKGGGVYRFRGWIDGKKEETLDSMLLYVNDCTNAVDNVDATYSKVNVLPNPVGQILHIQLPKGLLHKTFRVEIFSMNGKILHEVVQTLPENGSAVDIDVRKLKAGNYFMRLNSDKEDLSIIKQFVKQ